MYCIIDCALYFLMCVFFFKQKTAYEMRISDWSSDVCSSDLQPLLVEGRVFRDRFRLAGDARRYTELEFHRNYENAVKELGGVKVNLAQYTPDVAAAAGGRAAIEKHMHGAVAIPDYRHDSYLIRSPGHEYWIDVSTGSIPLHGYVVVVAREAMTQSPGFLDAAAMEKAIDRDGRVALSVNFELDQAPIDRTVAVSAKRVSVRSDVCRRRIIQNKKP